MQVQDFKAGFEFLYRKLVEAKGTQAELELSQQRVKELELELAREQAEKAALARQLSELQATFTGADALTDVWPPPPTHLVQAAAPVHMLVAV